MKYLRFILLLFLLIQCSYQPTQEEINSHKELKAEKNIDSLIVNFGKFKKNFPKSNYLKSEYNSQDNIETKIYDYCLKENSLLLWEKALPVLNNSTKYIIKSDIETNRKVFNRLKFDRSKSNIHKYLDSLLPKAKFNDIYFTTAFKEVRNLYEEIEKSENDLENSQLQNEEFAWKFAQDKNTIDACRKYLEFHPNGKHKKEVIDLQVDLILQGDYGSLPNMTVNNGQTSTQSNIRISNSTQYKLTVLYSGSKSESIIIPSGESKSIKLKSGTYRVSAYVDNYRVRNFAGTETINFSDYDVEYYIKTTRY